MKPPAAGNPAGLNAPTSLLFLDGTLSGFLLRFLYLAGCVFLFLFCVVILGLKNVNLNNLSL